MIKHGGCFDCGNMDQEILKSVTATRTEVNPKNQKSSTTTKSIALCDTCYTKEQRKGGSAK